MLQVQPFPGNADDLSQFIIGAWESTYAGRMSVPQWSGDYFRWQLGLDDPGGNNHIVSVCRNDVPVGVLLYFPVTFEVQGKQFQGTQASWLSVPAQYRGQGIARMLNERTQQVMRDQGLSFRVGFGYTGSRISLGPGLWKTLQGTSSNVRRVGFWVRVLDAGRAAAWNVNRWERWGSAVSRPFLGPPKLRSQPGICIRPIQQNDLAQCVELADLATRHCDLRLLWDEHRLASHLGLHGFSKALVAEERGEVRGCIGYHILPVRGLNTIEKIGVLDLMFVSELSAAARTLLLDSVLQDLQRQGAILALKLRGGDYPDRTFLRWGWFCKPVDSDVIVSWSESPQTLPRIRRLHVLWR